MCVGGRIMMEKLPPESVTNILLFISHHVAELYHEFDKATKIVEVI